MLPRWLIGLAALPLWLALPGASGSARAETLPAPNQVSPIIFPPQSLTKPPPGFTVSAREAIGLANATEQVRSARAAHPQLAAHAFISPLKLRTGTYYHWEVYYSDKGKQLVEVDSDVAGHVLEIQTAPDVGWPLVRGYPGVLGGRLNAAYIWLPLCFVFILPFVDPRRPRRLLHLDLLVLLGFGVSQWFFTRGEPDVSVPLVYPFLVYVVVRGVLAALMPRRRAGPLIPFASTRLLTVSVLALLLLRAAFGLTDSQTTDITTAGVVGADRILHGQQLYTDNAFHGDTYGPVNYLMYVPFELAAPYDAEAGDVNGAARPATLFFDLLVVVGLGLLGRQLRPGAPGRRLGAALAFAWVACPYSALVIASNTNDALVPVFVVYALLLLRPAPARGVFGALAAMAKIAPAILAPALIAGRERLRLRSAVVAGGAYAIVSIAFVVAFLPPGGLRELWDTTIGFQLGRESPLSIWVREPSIDWLRHCFSALAVLLAVASGLVPRRRSTGQIAAWCAALLALVQISANYWLYFYVIWFAPFLLLAIFEEYRDLGPRQASVTSDFVKPEMVSQPSSVTATRSSMRTPSLPGK
ncbi:MAG: hypothetical protein QOJ29_1717 [Thermoleophilaceae bacterium]|nr:hypothetical protein [Thermoleophilaceae bacterium]